MSKFETGDLVQHRTERALGEEGDFGLVMGPLDDQYDSFESATNWVLVLWDDGAVTPQYIEDLDRVKETA